MNRRTISYIQCPKIFHGTWQTKDEMIFLDGLGQWSTKRRNRKKLLQNYIKAAWKRRDWKGIDRKAVCLYARDLLKLEERR